MKNKYFLGQILIVLGFVIGMKTIPALNAKTVDEYFLAQVHQTLMTGPGGMHALSSGACHALKDQRSLFPFPLNASDETRLDSICKGKIEESCDIKQLNYPFLCPVSVMVSEPLELFVFSALDAQLYDRALLAIDRANQLPPVKKTAYQGVIFSKRSLGAFSSSEKVAYMKKSIDALNQAVLLDQNDRFARSMRLQVFSQVPKFFQDEKTLQEDRLFLERGQP